MYNNHFEEINQKAKMLLGKDPFEHFHKYVLEITKEGNVVDESVFYKWFELQLNKNMIPYFKTFIDEFRLAYIYWGYGKKHFYIEDGLADMLVQTDIHKVDASLLRLPFPCIYLTVPKELVELELPDNFFGESPLAPKGLKGVAEGAYVYERNFPDHRELEIAMFIKIKGANIEKDGKGCVGLTIPMNEGENVFDIINKQLNSHFATSLMINPSKNPHVKINRVIAERFSLLIINTLLYLQSDKAIMDHVDTFSNKDSSSKKKRKKNNPIGIDSPYIHVGKNITIDKKQRKMYKKSNVLKYDIKQEKRYQSQWIVRGHWRNQACGEGLQDRKLIWIQPYVKGSGTLEETKYTIK